MAGTPGTGHPTASRPAGFCLGRGHTIVFGNRALFDLFGDGCVGVPAREALVGLPLDAFELMDAVLDRGRPLARWIRGRRGKIWRMTVVPRIDPETGETYGIALYLRRREDPVITALAEPHGAAGGMSALND